jgi:uncharacterized membrane protein YhaH (DUF805 family)
MSWYLHVLKNYATFSGRAHRREFWMFVLINLIISAVLNGIDRAAGLTFANGSQGILATVYAVAVFLPGIALSVRRLHDIGKPGFYLLLAFIPCLGGLLLLYWYIQDSNPGPNAYGANPKT